jgi:hypothetical protein
MRRPFDIVSQVFDGVSLVPPSTFSLGRPQLTAKDQLRLQLS